MAATGRRRWSRWLRWVSLGLVGLVLIAGSGVLAVLWIPAASQALVRGLVARWDAGVAAQIDWRTMTGSLARGLAVERVRVLDGEGRPLITIDTLRIELRASSLVHGVVELEQLALIGVEVWTDHGWAALRGPAELDARQQDPSPHPTTPVEVVAPMRVSDIRVRSQAGELVHTAALSLDVHAVADQATASVTARDVTLVTIDLTLDAVTAQLRWDAPVLIVERLALASALASVDAGSGRYDLSAESGQLQIDATADLRALGRQLELPLGRLADAPHVRAQLRVRGGPDWIEAWLAVGDRRSAQRLELQARGTGTPSRGWAAARLEGLGLVWTVDVQADAAARGGVRAEVELEAAALGPAASLLAEVLGVPTLATIAGQGTATATCTAADVDAIAQLRCRGTAELTGLRVGGLGVGTLALWGDGEPLAEPPRGTVHVRAEQLRLRAPDLQLDQLELALSGTHERLRVRLDGRSAHERIELAATVTRTPPQTVEIALDSLALASDRAGPTSTLRLREPTALRLGDGAVTLDPTSLTVAGGRVVLGGRLGYGPEAVSDLRFEVEGVALTRVDPWVPGPALAGRVWLRGVLAGTMQAPRGWLRARVEGLRVAGLALGQARLVAALGPASPADAGASAPSPGRLRAWLRAEGRLIQHLSVAVVAPLRANEGGWRLHPDRPLTATLTAEGIELVELGPWMPDTPSWWRQRPVDAAAPPGTPKLLLDGRVDAELELTGTVANPRVAATVVARRLQVDRTRLGSARLRLGSAGAQAWFELLLAPGFGQLELRGRLPVHIDLRTPQIAWREAAPAQIAVDLRGLDLAALAGLLAAKLPATADALATWAPAGIASVGLRASGSLAAPSLAAVARVEGLTTAGLALGRLAARVSHEPGAAVVELQLVGPLAERLDARAAVPVALDLRRLDEATLIPDQPLRAALHVTDASLTPSAPVSSAALRGQLSADVELRGTLAAPRLDLRARVTDLARAGPAAVIGDLGLRGRYRAGQLQIDAELIRSGRHVLAAVLDLPVRVDLRPRLAGSSIAWARRERHRLLVAGRGLDEELLEAALGRPPSTGASAGPSAVDGGRATGPQGPGPRRSELSLQLVGGGSLDDFVVRGTAAGTIARGEAPSLDLCLVLDADETHQAVELTVRPERGPGLDGTLTIDAAVPRLVAGRQRLEAVPFSLRLHAPALDLVGLAPLLPASVLEPEGVLHATLIGGGRLGAPRLRGRVALRDGAATLVTLRQRVRDVGVDLRFDGRRVELRRMTVAAGRGGIEARGAAQVRGVDAIEAELQAEVTDFPLVRPGLPAMVVDAGVELDLWRDPSLTRVAARLRHPAITVATVVEDAPTPIPTSDDVELVHAIEGEVDRDDEPPVPASAPERVILSVVLADPLWITGTSIDMRWAGALELRLDGSQVRAGGQLVAGRGHLRLLGNRFDLRRGVVTLPAVGGTDPFVDLRAVASLPDAEVTATVRGRLSRPSLELASSPAMSEVQILTLLVTGATEVGAGEGEVAAKAASLLAAVSNPQLQTQLQLRLGIDRATLGFGETVDQPILTVGERITRDVYVETSYHHNAPEDRNTTQVSVEYGIRPRWTIESLFGDAAVGSFGVYWTRSFPAPAWTEGFAMPDLQIRPRAP